jgi:hypothetical protein
MGVCPVVCVQRASVHRRSRDEAAKIDRELLRLLWDVEDDGGQVDVEMATATRIC